ncbi:MAG: hypothetical protein CL678_02450 [Bdellovibrionaceae bacterium]|nr:hypothetical protein [Pseudobdellovibrionaceae bacterium]|tara:strand:+ start:1616 stop:2896 length:1281 start_codon:yes stop_codon:yes gene_type:complete
MEHSNKANTIILKEFLRDKIKDKEPCAEEKDCVEKGRSSQIVKICKDKVYKGPPNYSELTFNINEKSIDGDTLNYVKLNNHDMNLLIQSIFNYHYFDDKHLEKYEEICQLCDSKKKNKCTYSMVSKKMKGIEDIQKKKHKNQTRKKKIFTYYEGYTVKYIKKNSLNLEDYIQNNIYIDRKNSKDVHEFLDRIVGYISQLFNTLDFLHKEIQFHHCDPKAGQILIIDKHTILLSDFDKVTFTLNINNSPVRVINNYYYESITRIVNEATRMRSDLFPRKNTHYEKLCFLSSILLCFGFKNNSNKNIQFKYLYDLLLEKLANKNIIEYKQENRIFIKPSNNTFDSSMYINYKLIHPSLGNGDRLGLSSKLITIENKTNLFLEVKQLNSVINIDTDNKIKPSTNIKSKQFHTEQIYRKKTYSKKRLASF